MVTRRAQSATRALWRRLEAAAAILPWATATEDLFKIELLSQLNVFSAISNRESERVRAEGWVEVESLESTVWFEIFNLIEEKDDIHGAKSEQRNNALILRKHRSIRGLVGYEQDWGRQMLVC